MADVAYCATCKSDVNPVASIGSNMQPERVCPGCAGALPIAADLGSPAVAVVSMPARTTAQQLPARTREPAQKQLPPADLVRHVRERKQFLRAEIRRMQRELAGLERMGAKASRPKAPLIKLRGAS